VPYEVLRRPREADGDMDGQALRQLRALGEVARSFDDLGIDYRLFGGWAVDFYVGSVTRVHDDVDLAVWLADRTRIAQLLADAGWQHAPHADEDGGTGDERNGVRVELTFLVKNGVDVLLPLQRGSIVWPYEHRDDVGEIAGVSARLVSFSSLVAGKSFRRDDLEERAKDCADLAALRRAQSG
jgi:Aminoglycoside-2''-adenylyltransferase